MDTVTVPLNYIHLYIIGNTAPFLYTSISLLPENSLITDVQQVTGRNGQQWITCSSGRLSIKPQFWKKNILTGNSNLITPSTTTPNSVTIWLDIAIHHSNGLYYCFARQTEIFSIFLRNSGKVLTHMSN